MTKSRKPCAAYMFMMCQRSGSPPTSTIGFGLMAVSSANRVPRPPARITVFIRPPGRSRPAHRAPLSQGVAGRRSEVQAAAELGALLGLLFELLGGELGLGGFFLDGLIHAL